MRRTFIAGLGLTLAAPAVVLVSAGLDLDLVPTGLLGLGIGAVTALIPDRTASSRLLGVLAGIATCWLGYVVRARFLPDADLALAVTVGLVVAAVTALSVGTRDRLRLWAGLLGAATMSGAFERIYTDAPAQVLPHSFSTITSLALTMAVGYLVTSAIDPTPELEALGHDLPRARRLPAQHTVIPSTLDILDDQNQKVETTR